MGLESLLKAVSISNASLVPAPPNRASPILFFLVCLDRIKHLAISIEPSPRPLLVLRAKESEVELATTPSPAEAERVSNRD